MGHQLVAHQVFLHGQKVDVILPDGAVNVSGAGIGAVSHPPLGVGLVENGQAGVVQRHEHGPLPKVIALHQRQDGLGQGFPLTGGGLELDKQAHAALVGQAELDKLLQSGGLPSLSGIGQIGKGDGPELLQGQVSHVDQSAPQPP